MDLNEGRSLKALTACRRSELFYFWRRTKLDEIQDFRSGDTLSWTKSPRDFRASDGWTAKYKLSGPQQISITATADGDSFDFTIKASDSASYAAGAYTYAGWVEKGTGPTLERYTLWSGTIDIEVNLATLTGAQDNRSYARKTLDSIEQAIASYAVRPVQEIEIAGRRVIRPSLTDLMKFRSQFLAIVQQEDAATAINSGNQSGTKILVRTGATS